MKFTFEIKTEPVTQATIIVSVLAFSSGSLASIASDSQSPSVSTFYTAALAALV